MTESGLRVRAKTSGAGKSLILLVRQELYRIRKALMAVSMLVPLANHRSKRRTNPSTEGDFIEAANM